jgi:hypothetical protein
MISRRLAALALFATTSACGGDDPAPQQTPLPEPAPEPDPAPAPVSAPDSAPDPDPTPTFDPKTVPEIEARVVSLLQRTGWSPCGVIHSVGAIEVEVLGVGEPAPHMILFVSCPADFGHRELLVEGKRVAVTLHARRQMWPRPAARLPDDLPVRYVKSMRSLDDG